MEEPLVIRRLQSMSDVNYLSCFYSTREAVEPERSTHPIGAGIRL